MSQDLMPAPMVPPVPPRPTTPSWPPALRSLLSSALETRQRGDTGDPYLVAKPSEQLPVPTAAQAQAIEAYVAQLDRFLAPAEPELLVARVTVLLAQWYVPNVEPWVQQWMLADWAEILGPYPGWLICWAALEWLRTERRKPTPARKPNRQED